MAGFPLMAIGAGIGQAVKAYQEQQEARQRTMMLQMQLERYNRELEKDKIEEEAAAGLGKIDLSKILGGGVTPVGPTMPSGGGIPSAASLPPMGEDGVPANMGRNFAPVPGKSNFASGLRKLTELGVNPDVAAGAVSYMDHNENGFNPLAINPTSGAFGRAQWLGPRKAALVSQYGDRPHDDQQAAFMGSELLGPERSVLQRLLSAKTAKEGYDIWGTHYERPGAAALAKAGVGGALRGRPTNQIGEQWTAAGRPGAGYASVPTGAAPAPGDAQTRAAYFAYNKANPNAMLSWDDFNRRQPDPPPQMAQAQPQSAQPPEGQAPGLAVVNLPAPKRVQWGDIVQGVNQQFAGAHPKVRAKIVETIANHMGKEYEAQFKVWNAEQAFRFEGRRDDTTRRGQDMTNSATIRGQDLTYGATTRGQDLTYGATTRGQDLTNSATIRGQDLTYGATTRGQDMAQQSAREGNATTERGQDITKWTTERGQDSVAQTAAAGQKTTERGQDLTDKVANRNAAVAEKNAATAEKGVTARIDKVQDKQRLAVGSIRTLADRARYLLDAVEGNPNLVGARGVFDRWVGTITEQAGAARFKEQKAEFDSVMNLLRQEIRAPLKISGGYMSKAAIEKMQQLVPSEAITSAPQAKAALRNLAKHLDEQADQLESVMGTVKKDYEVNDDAIREWLKQNNMGPPQ